MNSLETWKYIQECASRNVRTALLVVVSTTGASPGKPGFIMAVAEDMGLHGTIGGGAIEYNTVELTRSMLSRSLSKPSFHRHVLRENDAANHTGMLCGGEQTILIYPIKSADMLAIKDATSIAKSTGSATISLSPQGISCSQSALLHNHYNDENNWRYDLQIGFKDFMHIIGGGHVSLALSRVLSPLDFHTCVLSEQADINTVASNTYAHEIIIDSFASVKKHIKTGQNSYVVIMTSSHRADEEVLRLLLDLPLRYLGMMGSASKKEKIWQHLIKDGIHREKLNQLYVPIGLSINSRTANEIAISIAAQLISIRNQ